MSNETFGNWLSWPVGEFIMTHLPACHDALTAAKFTDLALCQVEYFKQLRERRRAAMKFAVNTKPGIIFIGHVQAVANMTVTQMAEARLSDQLAWNKAQTYLKTGLFLFEESNQQLGDGPVTADAFIDVLHQTIGRHYPRKRARRVFEHTGSVNAQLIKSGAPIYAGEEWPLMAEFSLRNYGRNVLGDKPNSDPQVQMLYLLIHTLTALRSEIMVIRALERLRETGRYQAVIIQGAYHGQHMTELSAVYGFNLTKLSAVPKT